MKAITALLLAVLAASTSAKPLVCYYGSWSVYRQGDGHFVVEDIDPNLCTHLVYSFVGLQEDGNLKLLDAWNDEGDEWHEGAFTKIHKLMEANPSLKVMLAVGGWNHGPFAFQTVVKDPARRATFVQSSVEMIKKFGFHGLDIDWEYQNNIGGTPEDRTGYSTLLREMRARFNQENLLLSAAVAANFNLMVTNYDVPVLSETLDWINVMSYDLHGPWENHTGHIAPIYPLSTDQGDERQLNVEAVIKRYIELGANPAKINMGFVTYGHTFRLANAGNSNVNAPVTGAGEMGSFIPEAGSYAYGEYCMKKGQWSSSLITEQGVPYAVMGDQWLGYDDLDAVQRKLELLHKLGLGGALVWSIETDDFRGACGGGTYPIINAIKRGL